MGTALYERRTYIVEFLSSNFNLFTHDGHNNNNNDKNVVSPKPKKTLHCRGIG